MRTIIGVFIWMLLTLPAMAAEELVDVAFSPELQAASEGKGEIALWVEDARQDKLLGRSVDDDALMPKQDIAAVLFAWLKADLQRAGFQVVPYQASEPKGILIQVKALSYTASKSMLKTTAEVEVTLTVQLNASPVTHTFQARISDEFAWKPSSKARGLLIGEAVASATRAALADKDVKAVLER